MYKSVKEFNNLFYTYKQRFIRFAYTYVHDEDLAEDFVIDTIVYYWEHKEHFAEDFNVLAYMLTILKNKCIDYLRHQQIHQNASDEISLLYSWDLSNRIYTLEALDPEEIYSQEIKDIVNKVLSEMPTQTKTVFMMSRYENKSNKEIALELGITVKGVEYHLTKSMKILRVALKDYLPASLVFLYLL